MPAAFGKFFVSVISAPSVTPCAYRNADAAFSTMFVESVGTPVVNCPLTFSLRVGAGEISMSSPTSANTTRLSKR